MNTRRITFTVMLRMSVVAAALAGMLYAGRLESGRYRWGTGYERSVIAAVILVGTGTGIGLGSVIGSLFGSQLIGMINIALSSRASTSAAHAHAVRAAGGVVARVAASTPERSAAAADRLGAGSGRHR